MNLEEHYRSLYLQSVGDISKNQYRIDPLIDAKNDLRRGLTLLIRPSEVVKNTIQQFLTATRRVAPEQYYYPSPDIHVTVLSIVSCYAGFKFPENQIPEYINLIEKSLPNIKPLNISFKGITASRSGILLRGYPDNLWLDEFRDNLRFAFKHSALEQSIDRRYAIRTAHSTVIRFKKKIENKVLFLETVDQYKDYDFGSFSVGEIIFVYNDWYQKRELTKTIEIYFLA